MTTVIEELDFGATEIISHIDTGVCGSTAHTG